MSASTDQLAEMAEQLAVIGSAANDDPDQPEQVRDLLAGIARTDPEVAHAIHDELALVALRQIAAGVDNPTKYATDALTVLSAEFPRWCA